MATVGGGSVARGYRRYLFLMLTGLSVLPALASAKDRDDLLLELLECHGPADPDWRPLAAVLAIQGTPYVDQVAEICFEPEHWVLNGLEIIHVCGRGLPRTPFKTDYFSVSVGNSEMETVDWMKENVGPTRAEVSSSRWKTNITCWPRG